MAVPGVQICLRPAFTDTKCHLHGHFLSRSHKSLVILVIIVLIVNMHSSQSSPVDNRHHTQFDALLVLDGSHGDRFKQCKTDSTCREHINPVVSEHVLCVDSFCRCGPNYKTQVLSENNQSEAMQDLDCLWFECLVDEHCQEYDHHRVCQTSNGACVCRQDFLEDSTNGQKCVPQYGIMPAYSKQSRKYLNKNRISYREDIEHWPNKQALWLQYLAFIAFFVGQVCMLVHYVAKRRKKMMQKILTRNLVGRQNSDQVPITEDRSDMT